MFDNTRAEYDVAIVGAGLSAICMAYYLKRQCPDIRLVILESKSELGGTWSTFQFPGVRADSDPYTYSFSFAPWSGAPIATGLALKQYLNEVSDRFQISELIQFDSKVLAAEFNSKEQLWRLDIAGEQGRQLTANFMISCAGYFDHDQPHIPDFAGLDHFEGVIVHPQNWPAALDCKGKRVAVIGSGATAATLIPAIADEADSVTLIQRSPSYYDELEASSLDGFEYQPDEATTEFEQLRQFILNRSHAEVVRSKHEPEQLKTEYIERVRQSLPDHLDVETHFTPRYRPWQQRVVRVEKGGLFKQIADKKVVMRTASIDKFGEQAIVFDDGSEIEADIVVMATGFSLKMAGGIKLSIDGEPVTTRDCFTYRGIMLSGVPNFAKVFGYLRTAWTMRAELIAQYISRLLGEMSERNALSVTPQLRDIDDPASQNPFIDPDDFNPKYMRRGGYFWPRQGDHSPWQFSQDYFVERDTLPTQTFDDGVLQFFTR